MKKVLCFAVLAVLCCAATATAQFDEATDGEFSGDPNAPTGLGVLNIGSTVVSGSSVLDTTNPDGSAASTTRDIFSFTIGAGFQLESVEVLALTQTANTAGDLDPGFFYFDEGLTTVIPGADTSADILSGNLFGTGTTDVGVDLLEAGNITAGPGIASGVLGPGDFTLGIQQTGPELLTFSVSFNVTAVPEPSSAVLLSGLVSLVALRRRR